MEEILKANEHTTQLDLSSKNIKGLMHLISGQPLIIRLSHLKGLKMLDLSSNLISELFKIGAEIPYGILE